MKVYGDDTSGNCLKVRYTADYLGLDYEWVQVSALDGETRAPAYLAINPMGQIPAIVLDDGRRLAQSNAIIRFLAAGTKLSTGDAWGRAKIDEWLFWEQYSHEPYIAVCRFHMHYRGRQANEREAWRVARGEAALRLMEQQLGERDWLAGDGFSIADIALLAYTRLAHEGGFDLEGCSNVRAWIGRCESELQLEPASPGLH